MGRAVLCCSRVPGLTSPECLDWGSDVSSEAVGSLGTGKGCLDLRPCGGSGRNPRARKLVEYFRAPARHVPSDLSAGGKRSGKKTP